MTTFDNRDKAFENKFAYDEEVNFKAGAMANKLLCLWAGEKLGKTGHEADMYARSILEAHISGGHSAVEAKLIADLAAAGITITEHDMRKEYERLLETAHKHITGND